MRAFEPMQRISLGMLGLCLAAMVAAAGCGGGGGSADEHAVSIAPGDTARPRFQSIGTAPPGGAFFVVGGALAEVMNGAAGAGWQVTAEATKGSQENIRRLVRGEIDFALSNAAITYFAVRGSGDWENPQAVQVMMTLAPNVALFIAPRANGLSSIADLRGQRVVVGPAGAGFEYFLRPLLKAHGLDYGDFTPLNATQTGSVDMLADGSAAAAFLGGAIPTSSITQAATSQDVVFIPYDPATLEHLSQEYLFFDPALIPAGTYRGQEQEFTGLNVGSMHLITAAAADEEMIYQATRTIYENRGLVVEKHPAGRAINPANAARDTGTEYHPGAIRYYREIGIWRADTATP